MKPREIWEQVFRKDCFGKPLGERKSHLHECFGCNDFEKCYEATKRRYEELKANAKA